MKKMMKVFVSLLVVAMMVVLVPVQQVKATNFLLIKNSSTLQYKTSFVDEMGEGIVYSVTDYILPEDIKEIELYDTAVAVLPEKAIIPA